MTFVRIGLFRDHAQYRLNFMQYPPENSEGIMITHWARNPIAAELKAARCNVFYANNGRRPELFFMRNKPIIADFEGYFVPPDMREAEKRIDSPLVRKVICQTQWAFDDATQLIKKKENRDKLVVVKHAGRTDFEKNRRSDNEVRFFFIGETFFLKGADMAGEAFKQLYKKYDNIRLTIVSTNFTYWSLERNQSFDKPFAGPLTDPAWGPYWEKNLQHPGITFLPRKLSNEEKFWHYANSDVFLFPSKWETFGCVFLEAMAHSLPIITTNFGPIPEVVGEKAAFFIDTKNKDWYEMVRDTPVRTRLIAELKDYMEQMIVSKSLRNRMGRASREQMEREYSIEKRNKKMREIYDEVVG